MKKLFVFVASVLIGVGLNAQKIVGYIPQYRTIAWMDGAVEWDKMTDAYYFGSVPTGSGGITIEQPARFQHVLDKSSQHGLRPWLCVGGWNKSGNFITVARNATARQAFADEALRLCQLYGLEGIDIDWEFPAYGQETDFRNFLKTLYETLNPAGYKVSAACGGEATHADKWTGDIFDYIDDLNIMSYDAPSSVSSNHASLQFMKDAMDIYHAQGCPYEKMLGGVAFYSRPTVLMYSDISNASSNKQNTFETDGTGSQLYNGKNTINNKIDYVMGKGGVGILIWEVTQDVKGQYSLLNACDEAMEDYRCPIPKPDLGNDVSICGASSILLDGQVSGNYTYSWKKDGGSISGSSSTLTVTSAGVYELSVSDGSCTNTGSVEVLGVLPTVDLGSDFELCTPTTATLDAAVSGNGLNYLWKKNNVSIAGATSSTLDIHKAGTYEVTVSASGCSSSSSSVVVSGDNLVDVGDAEVCSGQTATLSVNSPGANPYNWYADASTSTILHTGNTFTTPTLTSATDYYIEEFDPSGGICQGIADWTAKVYEGAPGTIQVVYNGQLYQNVGWYMGATHIPGSAPDRWGAQGACGASCERTVVKVTIGNSCSPTPTISVVADQNNICANENVIFTATVTDGGASPELIWYVNNSQVQRSTSLTYSASSWSNNDVVKVELASDNSVNDNVTMSVTSQLTPAVVITVDQNNICDGVSQYFSVSSSNNLGSPSYKWLVNNSQVGTSSTLSRVLNNGDRVELEVTSSETCVTSSTATSNEIVVSTTSPLTPSVSIAGNVNGLCEGDDVSFSISTINNEGGTPSYRWLVNNSPVGTASSYTHTVSNGDVVKLELTSSESCVTTSTVNSNEITVSASVSVTPTVSINVDQNDVCDGTTQTLSVSSSSDLGTPSYLWKVNGSNVSTGTTLSQSFNDGDRVVLEATSSEACANNPAVSNEVVINVNDQLTPSVSITVDQNDVCPGTTQTFSVDASSSLGTPTYQWKINGTNAGTSSTLSQSFNDGDRVTLDVVSSETCVTTNSATSNEMTVSHTVGNAPTVVIDVDQNNVCSGTTQVLSVSSSTNLGNSPSYRWLVNGSQVSTNASLSQTFNAGDRIVLEATSSEMCVSTTLATSNEVTIQHSVGATPSVAINVDQNNVCIGTTQGFTVSTSSNLGNSPSYRWLVNGSEVSTSASLSQTFNDGDRVVLEATSSETCVSTTLATSNEVVISTTTAVTPSVAISVDQNNVCDGTSQTLSISSSSNLGSGSYQWKVNGSNSGTSSTLTLSFNNGDRVTLVATSSESCVTSPSVTSNEIVISTIPSVTPSVSISVDQDNVCSGTTQTFSISSSANLGGAATYTWSSSSVPNGNGNSYSGVFADGETISLTVVSSESCVSASTASANATVSVLDLTSNTASIPNQDLNSGFSSYSVDLSNYFTGENLVYSVSSSSVVGTSVSGNSLDISPNTSGNETLTVTASGSCGTASSTIRFNVSDVVIVNPVVTVNSPSSSNTVIEDGETVTIDIDVVSGEGTLTSVTAIIKDKSTNNQVGVVSITNSGNNYSGTWTGTEGNYYLEISASNSNGGNTIVTKDITVNEASVDYINIVSPSAGDNINAPETVTVELDVMDIMVTNVYVRVTYPDGTVTLRPANAPTYNYVIVPQVGSGDYKVEVIANGDAGVLQTKEVTFSISGVTSVSSYDRNASLNVYPIPSFDFVTVELENNTGEANVELYNATGTLVYQDVISLSNAQQIPVQDLETGVYILRVNTEGESYSKKLIVE